MNLVIAIRSKRKRDNLKWVTPLIDKGLRALPYRGDILAREQWHSEDNRIVLLSFSHAHEPPGPEPRIVEHNQRHNVVASLSGRTNISLTQGLQDGLIGPSKELHHLLPNLGGHASVVMVDRRKNRLIAANSVSCLNPLYWAENKELLVVGSWASAVHLIESNRDTPDYDVNNMVPFITSSMYFSDDTPYRNVKVLPAVSTLTVSRFRTKIRSTDLSALLDRRESAASDAFYDELTEIFFDCFRPLKQMTVPLNLGLTGGKDSRLLLAGLLGSGVDISTHTQARGSANHSDVEAAKMVAKATGVDHEIRGAAVQPNPPASTRVDLLKRTCGVLSLTDGMVYSFENIPNPPRYGEHIVFAGGGGEMIRGGGFVKFIKAPNSTTVSNRLNAVYGYREFLTEEQQPRVDADIKRLARPGRRGLSPAATLDLLYVRYRTRRSSAVGATGQALMQNAIYPLFDSGLIAKVYANTTNDDRIKELVMFNLLKRIRPELVDIPFANAHWGFHAESEQKKTMERYPECFMKPEAVKGGTNTDWRTYIGEQLKDIVMDQVLGCSEASSLFDVVDRKKVEALMNSEAFAERRYMNLAFSLYSASVLLSNAWLSDPAPPRPVEVIFR